ncbi:ABC transporter [Nonlabens spongiae]|uniref:ABC transporter n=2 Tax=Nonlabens spongiae TaxID=331648 RepID=A0A1W6MPR8_9FLAO|nr:ABC transporter [Nonlabens spongiae]
MSVIEKNNPTDEDVLVEVSGLSKKFCKDLKTSLWYGIMDLFAGYSGNKKNRELRSKEFWAVKDINFTLRRGECIGLIGHNGAGKSTLLKILNGLINPDEGRVIMRGKVSALIELGAGFNPILTGRENIYNNGAVLGFSRSEIERKLQKIIEFSELEEFLDMPVQNYSSGMKVRLGFAVAAQMEPDVLIIDEVLAVGDLGFKLKCFKIIDEILPKTAIIFVSHSMPHISRICNQIILLDRGKTKFQGEDTAKAIDLYYAKFSENDSNVIFDDGSTEIKKLQILDKPILDNLPQVNWGDNIDISLYVNTKFKTLPKAYITIFDKEQRPVAALVQSENIIEINSNELIFKFHIEKIQLSKGLYNINVAFFNPLNNAPIIRVNSVLAFQVLYFQDTWPPMLLDAEMAFEEV